MRDYEKILSDLRLKSLLVQSGMADPLYLDAADAIEELLAAVPKWYPVSEPPKRSDPRYAREEFIVRLESGYIMSLTYEFDNSDRCRDWCEPLFPVGWRKTASPVTHWTEMPKFEPPKEVE